MFVCVQSATQRDDYNLETDGERFLNLGAGTGFRVAGSVFSFQQSRLPDHTVPLATKAFRLLVFTRRLTIHRVLNLYFDTMGILVRIRTMVREIHRRAAVAVLVFLPVKGDPLANVVDKAFGG